MRLEDRLHGEYVVASGDVKHRLGGRLYAALSKHASAVCYEKLGEVRNGLVHHIVAQAFAVMHTFKGRSAFSTWFHRVAVNWCNMWLRRKAMLKEVPLEEAAGVVEDGKVERLVELELENLAIQLEPQDRLLLQLKYEGYTDEEISPRFGISRNGVTQRWKNLRKKLRAQLESKNV